MKLQNAFFKLLLFDPKLFAKVKFDRILTILWSIPVCLHYLLPFFTNSLSINGQLDCVREFLILVIK